jgi:hypothetical protein
MSTPEEEKQTRVWIQDMLFLYRDEAFDAWEEAVEDGLDDPIVVLRTMEDWKTDPELTVEVESRAELVARLAAGPGPFFTETAEQLRTRFQDPARPLVIVVLTPAFVSIANFPATLLDEDDEDEPEPEPDEPGPA